MEDWRTALEVILAITTIIFGWKAFRRGESGDIRDDTRETVTIQVQLSNMMSMLKDIQSEMKGNRLEMTELMRRVIVIEEQVKSAHRRIDEHLKGN